MEKFRKKLRHINDNIKGAIHPSSKTNSSRGSLSLGDQGSAYSSQAPGENASILTNAEGGSASIGISGALQDITQKMSTYPSSAAQRIDESRRVVADNNIGSQALLVENVPISTNAEGGSAGLGISGSTYTQDITQTMTPYPLSTGQHVDELRIEGSEDNVATENLSPRRGKTKEALAVAGRFTQTILTKIPDVISTNPVEIVFGVIKIILEAKEAISDNKDMLDAYILRAAERLHVVMTATGNGDQMPEGVDDPFRMFATSMKCVLDKLQKLKEKTRTVQIFDYEKHKDDIEAIFSEIENATTIFQLEMITKIQTIADAMDHLLKDNLLRDLKPATTAIHSTVESQDRLGRTTCTKDTRVNIMRTIQGWAEDTSPGSRSVFWLTGQAGSGKTTILQTIAEKYNDGQQESKTRLGASFFCSRRFPETRRRDRIIPTTAYQLLGTCTPYSAALQALNVNDAYPRPVVTVHQEVDIQLMNILVIPWQQSESARVQAGVTYLVVIDALDEMDGDGAGIFLENLFAAMRSHKLLNLKILVASRTSPDILKYVRSFSHQDEYWLQRISAQDASADVMTYLKSELPLLEHQHHLQIEEQAKGLFIYAATAVKFVRLHSKTPRSRQEKQLNKLLSYSRTSQSDDDSPEFVIDGLYRQIVVEAFSAYKGEEFRQLRKLLHTFLSTGERESPVTVADICGEGYDAEEARQLVKSLHAVLYTGPPVCEDEDDDTVDEEDFERVFWYHASFPDFIFDPARSKFQLDGIYYDFFCDETVQRKHLLDMCFQHLKARLRFNMAANIQSSFDPNPDVHTANPALVYSATNWHHHLPLGGDIDSALTHLDDFLELRALLWIEFLLAIWPTSVSRRITRMALEWAEVHAKHHPDLLEHMHHLYRFTDIYGFNVSIPQLYISHLSTYCDSELTRKWKSNFTRLPILSNTRGSDTAIKFDISGSIEMLNARFRHKNVSRVAFFDDTRLISADAGSVEILDIASGKTVRQITTDSEHVLSSLENHTVVTFSQASGETHILDAMTGDVVQFLPKKPLYTRAVAVSEDKKWIAQGHGYTLHTYDISSGDLLRTFESHADSIYVTTFTIFGKGQYMVSGSSTLRIWEVSTGETKCILSGHTDFVRALAVSSDDACIVSGSADRTVRLWSAATGEQIHCMEGHCDLVSSVAISNDSRFIVSGSFDATVRVWDAATGDQIMAFAGLGTMSLSVAISGCNTRIVVGLEPGVMLWDVDMNISTHRPQIAPLPDWALIQEGRLVSSVPDKILMKNNVLSFPGQGLMVASFDKRRYGVLDISQSRDIFGDNWASCYTPISHT